MKLRVVSYNIHKGYGPAPFGFALRGIREAIQPLAADLVLLQEVAGGAAHPAATEMTEGQFEFLAESIWPHFAYGRNAVYSRGHHGNAILSKHPIQYWENQDVSRASYERRGLLHAAIKVPGLPLPLHVICVHLSLFEGSRQAQLDELCRRVELVVPKHAPLLIGGDFNDWREKASEALARRLGLGECFLTNQGRHVKSFPGWLPVLCLDRLYYRGLGCVSAECLTGAPWSGLSDHLPLLVELGFPDENKSEKENP